MKKYILLLLLLTSCAGKNTNYSYKDMEDDEKEYWRRVEECGLKFRSNSDSVKD